MLRLIGVQRRFHLKRMMRAIGRADLADDPALASNEGRVKRTAELDRVIGDWAAGVALDEALALLARAEVPSGKIYSIADIAADPHYAARGMFERHRVDGRELMLPGSVPRLSETPGRTQLDRAAPGRSTPRGAVARSGSAARDRPRCALASVRRPRSRIGRSTAAPDLRLYVNDFAVPRGFPVEKNFVPPRTKVELINQLSRPGRTRIAVTSFVSPQGGSGARGLQRGAGGIDRGFRQGCLRRARANARRAERGGPRPAPGRAQRRGLRLGDPQSRQLNRNHEQVDSRAADMVRAAHAAGMRSR